MSRSGQGAGGAVGSPPAVFAWVRRGLMAGGLVMIPVMLPADPPRIDFVLPPQPTPWIIALVATLLSLAALGTIAWLVARALRQQRAQLPAALRSAAQKGFMDQLRAQHLKKIQAIEEQMRLLRNRLSLVFTKVRHLSTTLDPDDLFRSMLGLLEQEMGVDRFIVLMHDRKRDELYVFRRIGIPAQVTDHTIAVSTPCLVTVAFHRRQLIYREAALADGETEGLVGRPPFSNTILALPIATPNRCFGVIEIEGFADGREQVIEDDLRLFAALATFLGMAIENASVFLTTKEELMSAKAMSEKELADKKRLTELFGRYAHPNLVEQLIRDPSSIQLGGVTRTATVLFSDIVGFTRFSSHLEPEQVVTVINE